jgi:hypothetical protein
MTSTQELASSDIFAAATTNIFIGYHLTTEIKIHLDGSTAWKHAQALTYHQDLFIRTIHQEGKDYIGLYLDKEYAPLDELHTAQDLLADKIRSYCPALPAKALKPVVFAQLFVQ